jgi:Tfp pilus assembly protein PilZ
MSDSGVMVRALLVTDDLRTINSLSYLMQRLAIHVEICSDMPSASGKLCRAKFEAVIIDFNQQKPALELLHRVRESTAHNGSILFALLPEGGENKSPTDLAVHFVIRRPISTTEASRTFKAAYSLLVRERRRCFRCSLEIPVMVQRASAFSATATTENISEGGMALSSVPQVRVGEKVKLSFHLPGTPKPLLTPAEVCWINGDRMGLQFCHVPASVHESIQRWLGERLDSSLPQHLSAGSD